MHKVLTSVSNICTCVLLVSFFPSFSLYLFQLLIIDFVKDPEARVRSTALEVLSDLHESGISLESSVYDQASLALNDDYERVRTAALKVVAAQSLANPER